jgi:hypothetical protein
MSHLTLRRGLARARLAPVALTLRDRRAQRVAPVLVLLAAAWWGPRASTTLVVGLYGLILAALVLRWPQLGLPGLVVAAAFLPFGLGTGTQSAIGLAMIGVAGLTGLWVLRMILERQVRLRPSEANAAWIAVISVAGLSIVAGAALWNPWVVAKANFHYVQLAQWAIFILSGCAFWLLAHDRTGRSTLRVLTALLLAIGVVVLLGWLLPPARILSTSVQYVRIGIVFRIWVVALATSLAVFHVGLPRWLRAGLFALGAAMVVEVYVATSSWASGWLPALLVFGTVGVLWVWDHSHLLAVAATVAAGLMVGLYRFVIAGVAASDRWSLDTRLLAWRGLLELMEGRWLFGLGLASYWHYWRGVFGNIAYFEPTSGYLHYSFDPKVNMHNNYMDVFGQMGLVGVVALAWLIWAIYRQAKRGFETEPLGFGKAYAAACIAGFTSMLFAGMLGDWILPFVYNIGLRGFGDSFLGWLLLGGVVLLEATRGSREAEGGAPRPSGPHG